MSTELPHYDRTEPNDRAEPLLRLEDGELAGDLPDDVAERFRDGALLSAVYDAGTIRLQVVKI
jgi:hypothetical protein